MGISRVVVVLMAVCCGCASVHSRAQAPDPISDAAKYPTGDLSEFIRLYGTDHGDISRFYDLPWSEHRFDRMEQLYKDWQQKLGDKQPLTSEKPQPLEFDFSKVPPAKPGS